MLEPQKTCHKHGIGLRRHFPLVQSSRCCSAGATRPPPCPGGEGANGTGTSQFLSERGVRFPACECGSVHRETSHWASTLTPRSWGCSCFLPGSHAWRRTPLGARGRPWVRAACTQHVVVPDIFPTGRHICWMPVAGHGRLLRPAGPTAVPRLRKPRSARRIPAAWPGRAPTRTPARCGVRSVRGTRH